MSQPTRRERIEAMLADEPGDQFLRYGLAMELQKEGDYDRCLTLLDGLMADESPMVAAFFMAGQQLTRLRRFPEARTALRHGIELARRQGDQHAASEMSEYLSRLGDLGE
jgi:predicted Zn-dependent protease